MARKKFIDKRSATTYSLVYRSTDGADDADGAAAEALAADEAGQRVLAAEGADRVLVAQGGAGPSRPPPPAQDPRALYRHFFGGDDDDDNDEGGGGGGGGGGRGKSALSEAKRRELLSLGFPDDGYDYLKHMRAVGGGAGRQQQQQEQQQRQAHTAAAGGGGEGSDDQEEEEEEEEQVFETVGPATFLRAPRLRAPAPDVKLVDARGLRPAAAAPALEELEGEMRALGLGGAARARLPARGALAAELAEVEAALEAAEDEDDEADLLAAEQEAAEAEEEAQREAAAGGEGGGAGGTKAKAAAQRRARALAAAGVGATLKGRGDLEDDFLAFANAAPPEQHAENDSLPTPAPAAPAGVVVGFDAPSDSDEEEEEEEEAGGQGRRAGGGGGGLLGRRQGTPAAVQRPTDTSPTAAAAYADLNSQFDRLMQEEYDDEDEEDQEEQDEDEEEDDSGKAGRRRNGGSGGGARSIAEELTPARLDALLSGGVGGDEAPYDDSDDACYDDEAGGFGGGPAADPAAAERARARRERQRRAREQALAELEGCAPVVPNAARVATLDERDEDVLAATRARVAAAPRLRGDDEVDERGRVLDGSGEVGQGDEPLETLHVRRVRDRWDCESVLSLRTTASFQPSRIGDGSGPGGRRPRSLASPGAAAGGANGGASGGGVIRLSQRTGLPAGYGPHAYGPGGEHLEEMDEEQDEEEYDEDDEDAAMGEVAVLSSVPRPRDETAEEKKARKGAAKAAQRAARENKRQLKAAFREEAGKQQRQRAAVGAGSGASTFVIP